MRRWETILSQVFYTLAAAAVGYGIFILVMLPFNFRTKLSPADLREKESFELAKLKSAEEDQKIFSGHALFFKPVKQEAPKKMTIDQILQPYALSGIIQGASPEALIQNKSTGQTEFVREGQNYKQFKIIQIKSHSIVVAYQGEQKEMFISEGLQ